MQWWQDTAVCAHKRAHTTTRSCTRRARCAWTWRHECIQSRYHADIIQSILSHTQSHTVRIGSIDFCVWITSVTWRQRPLQESQAVLAPGLFAPEFVVGCFLFFLFLYFLFSLITINSSRRKWKRRRKQELRLFDDFLEQVLTWKSLLGVGNILSLTLQLVREKRWAEQHQMNGVFWWAPHRRRNIVCSFVYCLA